MHGSITKDEFAIRTDEFDFYHDQTTASKIDRENT